MSSYFSYQSFILTSQIAIFVSNFFFIQNLIYKNFKRNPQINILAILSLLSKSRCISFLRKWLIYGEDYTKLRLDYCMNHYYSNCLLVSYIVTKPTNSQYLTFLVSWEKSRYFCKHWLMIMLVTIVETLFIQSWTFQHSRSFKLFLMILASFF